MVTEQNATQKIQELLHGRLPAQRESTQPQHVIRQLSGDTTLSIVKESHK